MKGVKVDFFQSDKPWIIQHYLDILQDAAEFHLLVDFHGYDPRGWQRTFPNLMSMEAVRGAEIYSCCEDYGPSAVWQNTILPFTRNVIGSMDFTPVTFTDQKIPHQTTYAHELALSVLFESGVEISPMPCAATAISRILRRTGCAPCRSRGRNPVHRGLPGRTRRPGAPQGRYVVCRRSQWDDRSPDTGAFLPFLPSGHFALELISDGADPRSFSHVQRTIDPRDAVDVALFPAGGFVARFSPK